MTEVLYTVIGDLVGSRDVPDRAALQTALGEVLAAVNQHIEPRQPFEATVGDEYQGACLTLADAARASLLVRLALLPTGDTRCGLGHGEVTVHDASRRPLLQDGPGWWAARDAIEVVAGTRTHRRTSFVGPGSGPVNAFLTCRDQLVERLNERGRRILRLALLGHPQKEIAEIEQVTRSAVSQQFSRGVGAIVDAHAMLDDHGGTP
ncbi:MAG: SatD family protein [Nocardioides sp.]